jgi:nicotinamidase-related amidase
MQRGPDLLRAIVGVATNNGGEVTTRQAYELGFNITLATDAMTHMQTDAHNYNVTRVFPKIGETRRRRSSTFWKGSPDALDEL